MMHGIRLLPRKLMALFLAAAFIALLQGYSLAAEQTPLKVHNTYYGFELLTEKFLPDIQSTAKVFRHTKSGAQLLYLENDDDNKVFSISFRTPPTDSTGVAHIIEHSILCGSSKYPVKDPFLQMLKSSLYTYLNASTYPDKTMYPVASRNDKDFRNLMDVYLDAVFHPAFYNSPEVFQQEGWHYELGSKDDSITYKGVVYNEMKGAFSSPEGVLWRVLPGAVLPDTTYGQISGGHPDKIPELTREQFLNFHRKYYHPANSYIFLYGKMNILDNLKYLDTQYLGSYTRQEVDSAVAAQPTFDRKRDVTMEYSVLPGDSTEDKTYLSMSFVLGQVSDWETYQAMCELKDLLLDSPDAPLKRALTDAGIGKNVYGDCDGGLQPVFSIVVTNANKEDKEKFENTVRTTLQNIVDKGIDKELLTATFNTSEFRKREMIVGARTKGLVYAPRSLDLWLYGGDPLLPLQSLPQIKKKALSGHYFEGLIKKYLLDNPHSATLIFKPRPGLEQQKAEETKAKLADYKASLSDEQVAQLVEQTKKLKALQATPDTPEAIATLPTLELSDITPTAEQLPLEERTEAGIKVLVHPQFTNNIAYIDLYFDSTTIPQHQLPYLYLLTELLGKVSTDKHGYIDLSTELKAKTGGIEFFADAYAQKGSSDIYHPKLRVSAKALNANLPQLLELAGEIIGSSNFNDQQRLKELIQKIKAQREAYLLNSQQQFAGRRALSYISPLTAYQELNDYSFCQFITEIDKNWPSNADEVSRNLIEVAHKVFNRDGLVVGVVMSKENYPKFKNNLNTLLAQLGDSKLSRNQYQFPLMPRNEGIITTGKVQSVAKVQNYRKAGFDYSGKMKVLQTIINNEYLWNRVRVQGGAYGSSVRFDHTGNILFLSWRDPNLKETLDIYSGVADYLKNFNPSQRDMTNYIIATIGKIDAPLTPYGKGQSADQAYISGISYADLQREREEILATTPEDIRGYAAMFEALTGQHYLCVVGSANKIEENKSIFGLLINFN